MAIGARYQNASDRYLALNAGRYLPQIFLRVNDETADALQRVS